MNGIAVDGQRDSLQIRLKFDTITGDIQCAAKNLGEPLLSIAMISNGHSAHSTINDYYANVTISGFQLSLRESRI